MPDNIGLFPLFSTLHEKCHAGSELGYIYKSPRSWPKLGKGAPEPAQELCRPGSAVRGRSPPILRGRFVESGSVTATGLSCFQDT